MSRLHSAATAAVLAAVTAVLNPSQGAPTATDSDGMPDAWETRYGLNPGSAADANGDFDNPGYTNVEKYVNSLFA